MKFYMTYSRGCPDMVVPYAEMRNIPLMTSAHLRYGKNGFNNLWNYRTDHIVDSSGYSVQANYGEYPWSVGEYHRWLKSSSFEWAAVMDYACEARFDDQMSVDERVDRTIENTIKHFNHDPEYDLLPVLQGRSVEKYVECYDRLKDHGIPVDRVGLGTVCRISNSKEIVETERAIRNQTGVEWMHGFGVKINAYKHGATFDSADSHAWNSAPSNCEVYLHGDGSLYRLPCDDSRVRTFNSFKNYYDYVLHLKGEMGIKCPDCNTSFSDTDSMAKHSVETGHRMGGV